MTTSTCLEDFSPIPYYRNLMDLSGVALSAVEVSMDAGAGETVDDCAIARTDSGGVLPSDGAETRFEG